MGRERPRRLPWGGLCDSRAGSLTPHLCWAICAGALKGAAQYAAPTERAARREDDAIQALAALALLGRRGRWAGCHATIGSWRGGQPRTEAASPFSAPCAGEMISGDVDQGREMAVPVTELESLNLPGASFHGGADLVRANLCEGGVSVLLPDLVHRLEAGC